MNKKEYKIEVPIMTNYDIKQFENMMETEFESLFDKVSKHIYKERECIYLQKMVEKLKNDLEIEKEKNRQGKMRIVQLENEITARIEDVNKYFISKDKIRELLKEE